MPFSIVRDELAKMQVDAVVSMTDSHAEIGTERAEYEAAGPELAARYVLRTAAPFWSGCEGREAEMLRASYDAALTLAAQLDCATVAFPLPAGDGAFPREAAMQVAISAFTDFLLAHELTIYLVVPDETDASPAGSLFPDVRRYIDEHYAAERPAKAKVGGLLGRPRSRRERRVFEKPLAEDAAPGAFVYSAMEERAAEPQDLRDYLELAECGFSEYLLDLLKETGEKDADVYRRAGMSRQLFNKIINSRDYQPKKKTAIQLAIGLRLDMAQTQRLLEKAGYALTRSSKSDLVVQYFIQRQEYNIVAINLALFDCGLPLLCE